MYLNFFILQEIVFKFFVFVSRLKRTAKLWSIWPGGVVPAAWRVLEPPLLKTNGSWVLAKPFSIGFLMHFLVILELK